MDGFDRLYWDGERASYEDELDAWRERTASTAVTVAVTVAVAVAPDRRPRPARRPARAVHEARLDRRPLRRSSRRAGAVRPPLVHAGMRD
jgi:hypothetical protein